MPSFDVLHLLAQLVDHRLHVQADRGQARSFDLEHSVLTSRLNSCARKSSRRPTAPPLGEQLARGGDMGVEAVDLLADVGPGGEQHRLLVQPVGIERRRGVEERRDLLGEAGADGFGRARRMAWACASALRSRRAEP